MFIFNDGGGLIINKGGFIGKKGGHPNLMLLSSILLRFSHGLAERQSPGNGGTETTYVNFHHEIRSLAAVMAKIQQTVMKQFLFLMVLVILANPKKWVKKRNQRKIDNIGGR